MRLALKAKGFEDQPILARQAQIRDAHGRYILRGLTLPQPAGVVELVDAPDSKIRRQRWCAGSSPASGTNNVLAR